MPGLRCRIVASTAALLLWAWSSVAETPAKNVGNGAVQGPLRPPLEAQAPPERITPAEARPPKPAGSRGIQLTLVVVIERRMPEFLADTAARRLTWGRGIFGIGPYRPPGGVAWGPRSPPLILFPRAGMGSLNVDPNTGRSYFGQ